MNKNSNPYYGKRNKGFEVQKQIVYRSFSERPKTMLMVAIETGIMRSNITWFVSEWRKAGIDFYRIGCGTCHISKHSAGFYTSNKEIAQIIFNTSNTRKL